MQRIGQLTTFLLLTFALQSFGQDRLSNMFNHYEQSADDEERDSLWNMIITEFETELQTKNFGKIIPQNLRHINIMQYNSENGVFASHTISRGFAEHWNYITRKNPDNTNEIILKEEDANPFYIEIHDLSKDEFLLLTKYIDMSFSCYSAYVMKVENNYTIKQDAFNNTQDVLFVCSWTNVDESYLGKPDPVTGLPTIEGKMAHYQPIPILFDPKNKTISYSFYSLKNGKKITRKAKYKNEKFKIKSYDARTFEE